jgi:hypothetical protein
MAYKKFLAIGLSLILEGCANTAEYLRSQPVTHFPANTTIAVPEELKNLLVLHCMKDQTTAYVENGTQTTECLYVSADASKITSTLKLQDETTVRDKAITFLTSLSDMNCSNFLHRAFANRAGLDFTKSFIADLSTGASAGTAFTNPAISAALSISNLVVGKGVDSFNATYYFDKTFQALESAIIAERLRIKTYILAKQAQTNANAQKGVVKYEIVQALSDVRQYDDACSIKAGLAQLVQLADAKKNDDQKTKIQVELSDNPTAEARKLMGNKPLVPVQ